MKRAVLFCLSLLVVIFLFSCEILPESVIVHAEAEDALNSSAETAEITGITLNNTWNEINGSIASSTDYDYYRVDVAPGKTGIELRVYYNGEKLKGVLGINWFPMGFNAYNSNGELIKYFSYQGAVESQDLSDLADLSYLVFYVRGNEDYPSGEYVIKIF